MNEKLAASFLNSLIELYKLTDTDACEFLKADPKIIPYGIKKYKSSLFKIAFIEFVPSPGTSTDLVQKLEYNVGVIKTALSELLTKTLECNNLEFRLGKHAQLTLEPLEPLESVDTLTYANHCDYIKNIYLLIRAIVIPTCFNIIRVMIDSKISLYKIGNDYIFYIALHQRYYDISPQIFERLQKIESIKLTLSEETKTILLQSNTKIDNIDQAKELLVNALIADFKKELWAKSDDLEELKNKIFKIVPEKDIVLGIPPVSEDTSPSVIGDALNAGSERYYTLGDFFRENGISPKIAVEKEEKEEKYSSLEDYFRSINKNSK